MPPHKTLFKAAPGCGLPIGNLTSQFFANVYLDALDQYVKHVLKVRHYVRYCDDMVLLSPDRRELAHWEGRVAAFLKDRLHLTLNSRRKLRPVSDGIDFLGYIIRPDYLLVRRRVTGALRKRLSRAEETLVQLGMGQYGDGHQIFPWPQGLPEQVSQWLNSYLGHMGKASCHNLVKDLWRRFRWLGEYFILQGNKVAVRFPVPRYTLRFSQQRKWFQERLPDHVLMIQLGRFWLMDMETGTGTGDRRKWPERISNRGITYVRNSLWQIHLPVAWIRETGRRLGNIAERGLFCRWAFSQKS